jgi:hypothetical protein
MAYRELAGPKVPSTGELQAQNCEHEGRRINHSRKMSNGDVVEVAGFLQYSGSPFEAFRLRGCVLAGICSIMPSHCNVALESQVRPGSNDGHSSMFAYFNRVSD